MNVCFPCPSCDYPAGRLDESGPMEWHCPRCDAIVHGSVADVTAQRTRCVLCGNGELYKKKDFPHGLGMAILALACLTSTVTYWLYDKWWTWAILIGSAAFDGLLYLWVKDVVVCYRCNGHYRGLPTDATVEPFELTVHERHRQERARQQQMQNADDRMRNERQRPR